MTSDAAHPPDDDPKLDGTLLDQWWDFGDPAASIARFRLQLADFRAGSTAHAELRTQVARALTLQREESDALAELSAAAAEGPDNSQVTARLEMELGRVDNSGGRPTASIPHFTAAVEAARAAGDDFLLVDALHMLAIADSERADEWTATALAVTQASVDARTRRWIGSLRNNFGWSLHERGDFEAALGQFEGARDAYRSNGSEEQQRIADWAVARALRSLQRYDEAMAIQQQLAAGEPDGYVEEELAELLLAVGRSDEARSHCARAADLLAADPWLDEPARLARLRELATAPTR